MVRKDKIEAYLCDFLRNGMDAEWLGGYDKDLIAQCIPEINIDLLEEAKDDDHLYPIIGEMILNAMNGVERLVSGLLDWYGDPVIGETLSCYDNGIHLYDNWYIIRTD